MVFVHPGNRKPEQAVSDEMWVSPFVVAVDTREQAPWTFQGLTIEKQQLVVPRSVRTLKTGDYSIVGLEGELVIERKSAADLIGSITVGNERFRREHERMADVVRFGKSVSVEQGKLDTAFEGGFACVIVEGCLSRICDELDAESGRRVTSESILGAVASWPAKYRVPWYFAGDRRMAERLAYKIMLRWWKEHPGQ